MLSNWYIIPYTATHYNDVIMSALASQINSLAIVYSTVYSDADQRKHQSSAASLAFVRGIHRWPVNSPHTGPVTRKMFQYDDVIMFHLWGIFYIRSVCCNIKIDGIMIALILTCIGDSAVANDTFDLFILCVMCTVGNWSIEESFAEIPQRVLETLAFDYVLKELL